jgi:hypothetical protein
MNKATTTVGDMVLYRVIAVLVLSVGVLILRAISSDRPATHYIAEDPTPRTLKPVRPCTLRTLHG